MSNDIDFDQLIDLLDRALVSDDPKVKKALKKFLFIVALATTDEEETGPLRDLISRIEALEAKVNSGYPGTYTWPNTNTPMWYSSPGTGAGGGTTTAAISPNTHKYYTTGSTNSTLDFDSTMFDQFVKTTESSTGIDALIDDSMNDLADLQEQARKLAK